MPLPNDYRLKLLAAAANNLPDEGTVEGPLSDVAVAISGAVTALGPAKPVLVVKGAASNG